ncbi:MAG: hypothetical protein U1E17_10445 [Geminicoccaceae bacterium]|mgnify:CR=1 FL=1
MTSTPSQTRTTAAPLAGRGAPCLGLALVAAAGLWLGLGSTVALVLL